MGALDMTYSDVMNGDVPKVPARNPVALQQAAAIGNPMAQSAPAAVQPAPAATTPTAAPSIPPAAPNPTLMPVPPGIAKNTATNPNPMAQPATLADIRVPNNQSQPMQAAASAPATAPQVQAATPATAPQQATDPDIIMINGIPHRNVQPQTRNPLMIGAAISNAAEILVPKPFENRAAATLAANRAELNNDTAQPPAANNPQAGAPQATAATAAQPSPTVNPLTLQERQAGYMIDNNLRQFEDKGSGVVRQVDSRGRTTFTNVDTADVTDPTKKVQVNGYDGAADNASMAKANAIRQQIIDRQPQGGVAVLADPNEAANAEKTQRWAMENMMAEAGKGNRGAVNALAALVHNQGALSVEQARAASQAASETGRNAVTMRGQDIQAQSEAAKLAGNPLDNELKKQQLTAATVSNAKAQKQADALDNINAETNPAKRQAMIENLLVSQGKNPAEHRYIKVDGGEEIGPDGMTKIKKPSGVYDSVTQRFIPMTPAAGAAPNFSKADVEAAINGGADKAKVAERIKSLGGNPKDYGL